MRKFLLFAFAVASMASCTTITKTARTEIVPNDVYTSTKADLNVAPSRISYTYRPTSSIRRGGLQNCKQAAIQEALNANGNADILLEPQFVIETKRVFGATKIELITVTGRPATYTNFRSVDVCPNKNAKK